MGLRVGQRKRGGFLRSGRRSSSCGGWRPPRRCPRPSGSTRWRRGTARGSCASRSALTASGSPIRCKTFLARCPPRCAAEAAAGAGAEGDADPAAVAAAELKLTQQLGWRLGNRFVFLSGVTVRSATALAAAHAEELAAAHNAARARADPDFDAPRSRADLLGLYYVLASAGEELPPAAAVADVQTVLRRLWKVKWSNFVLESCNPLIIIIQPLHPTPAPLYASNGPSHAPNGAHLGAYLPHVTAPLCSARAIHSKTRTDHSLIMGKEATQRNECRTAAADLH